MLAGKITFDLVAQSFALLINPRTYFMAEIEKERTRQRAIGMNEETIKTIGAICDKHRDDIDLDRLFTFLWAKGAVDNYDILRLQEHAGGIFGDGHKFRCIFAKAKMSPITFDDLIDFINGECVSVIKQ